MINDDKKLIEQFFYIVLCFLCLFSGESIELWKIQSTANDFISKLNEINRKLSFRDKKISDLILDLESIMIDGKGKDNFLQNYKDFILSFSN